MARLKLQPKESSTKDSLSQVYVLIGRIQSLLITFAAMNNTDDMGNRIDEIAATLRDLEAYFKRSGKAAREAKVDKELSELIETFAAGFKLEQRGTISLDKNELTLSFRQSGDAKKEYLKSVAVLTGWATTSPLFSRYTSSCRRTTCQIHPYSVFW